MPSWNDAWLEAVASNAKANPAIETLELVHPAFLENGVITPVRCVNDLVDHALTLEPGALFNAGEVVTFQRLAFTFEHPDVGEGIAPSSRITVENIRQQISQYLDVAEMSGAPITVTYRVYMLNDPTTVALGPWKFLVREIDEEGSNVTGQATLNMPQNQNFPNRFMTADFAPALLRQLQQV